MYYMGDEIPPRKRKNWPGGAQFWGEWLISTRYQSYWDPFKLQLEDTSTKLQFQWIPKRLEIGADQRCLRGAIYANKQLDEKDEWSWDRALNPNPINTN